MYATGGVWCQLGATKVSLSLRESVSGAPLGKSRAKPPSSDPEAEKKNVLKEVGSTSTSFIGPACRPGKPKTQTRTKTPNKTQTQTQTQPQPKEKNIEESLSDFYQELECLDSPDSASPPAGQHAHLPGKRNRRDPPPHGGSESSPHPGPHLNHQAQPHWHPDRPYDHHHHHHDHKRPRHGEEDYWPPPPPQMMGRPRPPHRFPPPPPHGFSGPFPGPPPPPGPFGPRWTPYPRPPDQFPPPHMCPVPSPPLHRFSDGWGGGHSEPGDPPGWTPDPAWQQSRRVDSPQGEDRVAGDPDPKPSSSPALILMRGLPGSGKSTAARELVRTGPSGVILSTDDYFADQDGYQYDRSLLSAAHRWNQNRADEAMLKRCSPLIIDNTNLQAWEMKPYVSMALERGYRVYFEEPHTQWRFDPVELEKRNQHGVPQHKISHMLERFCFPVTVETVMMSQEPPSASAEAPPPHRRH